MVADPGDQNAIDVPALLRERRSYTRAERAAIKAYHQGLKALPHRTNCGCPTCAAARKKWDAAQDRFRQERTARLAALGQRQVPETWSYDPRAPKHKSHVDFDDMNERGTLDVMGDQTDRRHLKGGLALRQDLAWFIDGFSWQQALRLLDACKPEWGYVVREMEEGHTAREVGAMMVPVRAEDTVHKYNQQGRAFLTGLVFGYQQFSDGAPGDNGGGRTQGDATIGAS